MVGCAANSKIEAILQHHVRLVKVTGEPLRAKGVSMAASAAIYKPTRAGDTKVTDVIYKTRMQPSPWWCWRQYNRWYFG